MLRHLFRYISLTSILLCLTLLPNKSFCKKSKNANYGKIYIFGTETKTDLPIFVKLRIDSQIFAIFSGLDSFSSQLIATTSLSKRKINNLAKNLSLLSTNQQARVTPIYSLTIKQQKTLSKAYLLIAPTALEYQTITNKIGSPRTAQTNFAVSLTIDFTILRPYLGAVSQLSKIKATATHKNLLAAQSACVTQLGKILGAAIENATFFNTETEITHTQGLNAFFYNRDIYTIPYSGLEYSIYKLTRYEDGYVDETYKGIIRVSGKQGNLWKTRAIFGDRPQAGDRIIPRKRLRIALEPYGKLYFINLAQNRFSGFTNSSWASTAVKTVYGGGVNLSLEIGYSFRCFLDGSYFSDQAGDLTFLQGMLGFGWDFYLARRISLNLSLAGSLRMLKNRLGVVNDGSALNGETVYAKIINPGLELNLSLNFMLAPILLFKLSAGYSYYLPIEADDWNFYVGSSKNDNYAPTSSESIQTGGPFLSAAFTFRL